MNNFKKPKFIKEDINELSKKYKLNYLVLFGSQVDGIARKDSDFDIAYSSQRELDYDEEVRLAEFLAKKIKVHLGKIDLVNVKNAGPLLRNEIANNSIVLLEFVKNSFDNFQMFAFMTYIEAKPLFKMQKEYVDTSIKKYLNHI